MDQVFLQIKIVILHSCIIHSYHDFWQNANSCIVQTFVPIQKKIRLNVKNVQSLVKIGERTWYKLKR